MAESKHAGSWKDVHGEEVHASDIIAMPGVPFKVVAMALVPCEEGCEHGAAVIVDPESGEADTVCLRQFEIIEWVAERGD